MDEDQIGLELFEVLDGHEQVTIENPTEKDIRELCVRHGFDQEKTLKIARDLSEWSTSVLITAEEFRKDHGV